MVPRARIDSLRQEPGAQIYTAGVWINQSVIARVVGNPDAALPVIERHIQAVAPWLSVSSAEPMRDAVARASAELRFGTLIEAWASHKSFKPQDTPSEPGSGRGGGSNPTVDFRKQRRKNDTHASTTELR